MLTIETEYPQGNKQYNFDTRKGKHSYQCHNNNKPGKKKTTTTPPPCHWIYNLTWGDPNDKVGESYHIYLIKRPTSNKRPPRISAHPVGRKS